MKAIVHTRYGPPESLELQEIEKPATRDNQILVKVYATTVTTGDARLRGNRVPPGFGIITRLVFGFRKLRRPVLGIEFCGKIEAVGKDVKQFQKDDLVFGASEKMGCHAEYVALSETEPIAIKPANLTAEEAAAVPFGALTSLVYLRDYGNIQSGQRILVNGASGALGVFAVQLAKYYGAEVTGVCSSANVELVQSLGADNVIDYTREDITGGNQTYDIIFDTVGKLSFSRCKSILKDNGRVLMAVAGVPQFLQVLWTSIAGSKKAVAGVASFRKEDLDFVKELLETGKIKPVIDSRYSLEQIAAAHRHVDGGHKKGAVVINVAES